MGGLVGSVLRNSVSCQTAAAARIANRMMMVIRVPRRTAES